MGNHPFDTGERAALNAALMQGTGDIHREAERRPFMVAQFKGELPKDAYTSYLGRLFHVYVALEEAAEQLRDDPRVGPIYSPELFRVEGLNKDLTALAGPDWREQLPITPATEAYAGRIRAIATEFPPAYVAHHWLRYMGYVLGQELIRGMLRKAYGPDVPVAFYDYPDIDDPKQYLRGYHARMNGMDLSADEVARVVDEGNRAFQLQIDLTDELAREFGIGDADEAETDQLLEELKEQHP